MFIYEDCTIEEIQAMKSLQYEPFTEMTGLRKEDLTYNDGSEVLYFKIAINQALEDCGTPKENHSFTLRKPKVCYAQQNKGYLNKEKHKKRVVNKIKNKEAKYYYEKEDECGNKYISKYKKQKSITHIKRQSNKLIRNNKYFKYNEGRNCFKDYSFWR